MILGNEPDSQRKPAVLLPISQLGVWRGRDAGATTEGVRDDRPAVLMCRAQISIWKIRTPVILIGTVAGEGEIVVPVPEVEDEMKMEALPATVDSRP